MRTPLAEIEISSLNHGDVVSFAYIDAFDRPQKGFLVKWHDEFFAYQNLCPHWSTPLDEHGAGLLEKSTGLLICHTHGARFQLEDGMCLSGPCYGERLPSLRVEHDEKRARIFRTGLSLA